MYILCNTAAVNVWIQVRVMYLGADYAIGQQTTLMGA